jgi:prepilin-type N-terminal cleavage/methylation domain-containing protein
MLAWRMLPVVRHEVWSCMRCCIRRLSNGGADRRGFTLAEVVVSLAISGLVFSGVILGYTSTSDQAEWSAYSLAAHSLAMQGVEQARAAKWDPQAFPVVDELGTTNYSLVEELDVPVSGQTPMLATNYVSISRVSDNPPVRQLRADCVWSLPYRKGNIRGPFTNTVVTYRASDQ